MAFTRTSSVRLNFIKDLLYGGTHLRPSREFKGLRSNPNWFENGYVSHLVDKELQKKFRVRFKQRGEMGRLGERHKLLTSLQKYSRIKALLLTFLLKKDGKGPENSHLHILPSIADKTLWALLPVCFWCSCHKTTLALARKKRVRNSRGKVSPAVHFFKSQS